MFLEEPGQVDIMNCLQRLAYLRFFFAFMHSAHQNSREMLIQLKSQNGNSHAPHKLVFAEILCVLYSTEAKGLQMLRVVNVQHK